MANSSWFDESYYLSAKAAYNNAHAINGLTTWTVASVQASLNAAGMTAEQHYDLYGWTEGLSPNAYYVESQYVTSKVAALNAGAVGGKTDWTAADFYASLNGANPFMHYVQYGAYETGVEPSTGFNDDTYYADKAAYNNANNVGGITTWTADTVKAAFQANGLTPIGHYELYGATEAFYTPTPTPVVGQTYTLTTAIDAFTGTSGNDTFIGSTATSQTADSINGNGGTDILKIYSGGTAALDTLPQMTSIENLYLNGTKYDSLNMNVSGVAGLTSLAVDNQLETTGVAGATTYTLAGQAFTLENTTNATTGAGFNYTTNLASTTDTTENITLSNVLAGALATQTNTIDILGTNVTSASVTSSGTLAANTRNTAILADTGGKIDTLSVLGSSALDLTLSGFATAIKSVDASAATGSTIIHDANTADLATTFSYKGGSGNDTLDLSVAQVANVAVSAAQLNAMTFDFGQGTDTIELNNAIATGTTKMTSFTGAEIIGVSAANGTVNMANFPTATGVKLYGTVAGGVTVNNLASTGSFDYSTSTVGANAVSINAAGSGTSDVLTMTMGSATAAMGAGTAGQTIAGYETVNLTSQGAANSLTGATSITASAGGSATLNITATKDLALGALTLSGASTAINITGSGAVTFAATTAGSITDTGSGVLTTTTGTNVLSINASSNNANNVINDDTASSAASISVGNGNNNITAGAFNDVITAGTGANAIKGGAGADRITVGAHNGTSVIDAFTLAAGDTGVFAVPGTNSITTSAYDVYSGAVKGDTITFTAADINDTALTSYTDLSAVVLVNNQIETVRGTYDSSANTFVGSSTGTDLMVIYDNDSTAATAFNSLVLTGVTSISSVTSATTITI